MSTHKHTPGPWKFGKELTARSVEWLVSFDAGSKGRGIAIAETCAGSGNEDANARLIAAAPELLEACQTFAEWLRREEAGFPAETRFNTPEGEAKWREWFDENFRICDLAQKQARAAIAKATGGEA